MITEKPSLDERSIVLNLSLIPTGWITNIIWNSNQNYQSTIIKIPKFKYHKLALFVLNSKVTNFHNFIFYWIDLIKNKNVRTLLDFSEGSKSSTRIDALSVSLWTLQKISWTLNYVITVRESRVRMFLNSCHFNLHGC